MRTPTRTQVANKVHEVVSGVDPIGHGRGIDDIPKDFALADGAREIAVLTLTAISHDFEFNPVMAALEKLAALKDWSHSFFVAHVSPSKRPTFNWRDAPMRKYESFADFYRQELERTFGTWESLQHTWSEVVKGKITETEGRDQIEARAKAMQQLDAQTPVLKKHGRPGKDTQKGDTQKNSITFKQRGTSNEYAISKLRKDAQEIHARVLAGELSPHAGMIEAGFRKKRASKKLTALDHLNKWWDRATSEQRATFLAQRAERDRAA